MKSTLRAAVALGVLALAATQASASTYSNNPIYGPSAIALSTGGNDDIKAFLPQPSSFTVNTGGDNVYSTFSLIDTQNDGMVVDYQITNLSNSSIFNASLIDALGTNPNTGSFSYLFLAGVNYSLAISSATSGYDSSHTALVSAVPLPAAAWLFGSALLGLGALRRKQKAGVSEMAVA